MIIRGGWRRATEDIKVASQKGKREAKKTKCCEDRMETYRKKIYERTPRGELQFAGNENIK